MAVNAVEVLKPEEMSDQEMIDLLEEETNKRLKLIEDCINGTENTQTNCSY